MTHKQHCPRRMLSPSEVRIQLRGGYELTNYDAKDYDDDFDYHDIVENNDGYNAGNRDDDDVLKI